MSCKDTIHLLCWYLEGFLSEPVEAEIRQHLNRCTDCSLVLGAAINILEQDFDSHPSKKHSQPQPCAA
jgi:hypothetical protein